MLGMRGKALSGRAHYEAAIGLLEKSVATARRCGDVRQAAWSLAILRRALLVHGQWPDVAEALDDSLEASWQVTFARLSVRRLGA